MFKPGQKKLGGRKKGVKNKRVPEIRTFARNLLADRDYRRTLRARLKDLTLDPGLIRMLYQYAFGRPPDKLEISGPDGGPIRASAVIYLPDNGREKKTT